MTSSAPPAARPAHLGWRLLALVYDALPNIALWFLISAVSLLLRPSHEAFAPWSAGALAVWLACWLVSGSYAVLAWRRGGQTLGMKPWRLKVVAADGRPAEVRALWLRYAVATVSLAACGLGFLWCLVDRERRALHDVVAGTVLVRTGKAMALEG
ncbi:RDD family protein [Arenimonas composti]|uniref:RDD domain-containing protein n=1 Tax=Arenimonas composti TR7-09 = DSM 18010 TaxID=1121013 RepID=A0A091C3W2_9GAMM|nr:RDD family protein [Arenimonas composti]KFN51340.1 hypothetical protein P873_03470 [Arenimonas composti TR7-09 = DSM 18010]